MDKRIKKSALMLIIVISCVVLFSNVFAQITISDLTDSGNEQTSLLGTIAVRGLTKIVVQPIITAIVTLIKFFLSVVVMVLGVFFSLSGVTIGMTNGYFPLPHHMVFNLIPMLDPNFINPAKLPAQSDLFTMTEIISTVISPIYFTMIALATTTFIIIALFIGIKLAISVSAGEKAQYKTAVMTWITGLTLLFVGHFLMSGIFYINEQIVSNLYEASAEALQIDVTVPKQGTDAEDIIKFILTKGTTFTSMIVLGPFAGNVISNTLLAEFTRDSYETKTLYGFDGVISYYYQDMMYNSNPISTLIMAVMLGQVVALLILYLKRVVYAIILGLLYPFVIIIDTYKKVAGSKSGGLFEKWLQQFSITVFMQSIHAIIMFFTIAITNEITKEALSRMGIEKIDLFLAADEVHTFRQTQILTLVTIIQMGAIASLTRLEGIIKDYLGVPDAKAGSLKGAGMLGYSTFRMGSTAIKNVADNFSGVKKGRADVVKLRNKLNNAKAKEAQQLAAREDANFAKAAPPATPMYTPNTSAPSSLADGKVNIDDINQMNQMMGTDNPGLVRIQNSIERLISAIEKQGSATVSAIQTEGSSTSRLRTANNAEVSAGTVDKKLTEAKAGVKTESVQSIAADLKAAEAELSAKTIAKVASFGFVPGSLALGLGMTSSMDDTAKIASAIINIGDKVSETVGKNLPTGAQHTIIQQQVNYEEYLQQKIVSAYSGDKYEKAPRSNSKGRVYEDVDHIE